MLSTLSPDSLIPADHPIRRIKAVVEAVLADLGPEFDAMYAAAGRHSVPPEHLLKASVLMALYSIRSERQFCERLRYDLLFKYFLDLNVDDEGFDHSTFSKNRERLLKHEVADRFFAAVVRQARLRRYVSGEHFSVDGTLLEAWASHKSFRPKDEGQPAGGGPSGAGRNAEVNFHGQLRSNETHRSTTDPEALLARKSDGVGAKLSYAGHLLMEHRNALIVDMELTQATGRAERETGLLLLGRLPASARRRTVAGDKGYDTREFVAGCREIGFTPHVAPNISNRRSAIDGRTTRHPGHLVSQRIRKRIEEPFGWLKTIAGGRKLRYIGGPPEQSLVPGGGSRLRHHPNSSTGRPAGLKPGEKASPERPRPGR
jgi:transposase